MYGKASCNVQQEQKLRDILGSTTIENNKAKHNKTTKGRISPSNKRSKCCKHVVNMSKFQSSVTKKTYNIWEVMHCKDTSLVYLLSCMKYVNQSSLEAGKHFTLPGHNFNRDVRFILIEEIHNLAESS